MAIVLVRIDDRLIHGQVVGGWLPVIQAERVVVVSDRAAGDALQTGLMRMAVPDGVTVDVLTLAQAVPSLKTGAWGAQRVLLLLPGLQELAALVDAGVAFAQVNLGGLHDAPGRSMVAAHLAFSGDERALLVRLVKGGVRFETRPLPGDVPVPLNELIPGLK
ncbi:MAG: PTS sugar transporter subunit IIB [Elusimicrobia bacterium]|nr:PTS sugar transporter subunit IIB [Elusimicrobiota bacterium]MBP9128199.1 PTS sugar transporter subunit IIB [Elusimicrobiota bacterium]